MVSNPEFLKEGAAIEDFMKPDRVVVGTDNPRVTELLRALYEPFTRSRERLIVMDVRSAELTKYAANAMLATKISFMNELANLAERFGADIEKVRVGIGSDPRIGYHFIYPGPGLRRLVLPEGRAGAGASARGVGYEPQLLDAVEAVNKAQKQVLFEKITKHFGGNLKGKTIALWGLAFKPNTDDMREAPRRVLLEQLWEAGAKVRAYDPAAMKEAQRIYGERADLALCTRAREALEGADALAIVTEWKEFRSPDFDQLKKQLKSPVIFDGRNLYDPAMMKKLGFTYYAIGRGESQTRLTLAAVRCRPMKLVPVILSGGAGTRLWPLSRELLPKQLLALTGERTMLQETAARLAGFRDATGPVVVCNEAHRFLVAEQLREMELRARRHPARARRPQHRAGHRAGRARGARRPRARTRCCWCCPPITCSATSRLSRPRSRRGYRRRGRQAGRLRHRGAHARNRLRLHPPRRGQRARSSPSRRFVEKPDLARAREFVASGEYFWNSGMFLFGARRFLDELGAIRAGHRRRLRARQRHGGARHGLHARRRGEFAACRSDSVDYAVMEKTRDAVMVPLDAGWNDVGSWAALHEVLPADEHGNVVRGDVLLEDTADSYVHADSRLVAALGLHDMVIVETADAVLVAPKAKVQDVKKLVARIKAAGRAEHVSHAVQANRKERPK